MVQGEMTIAEVLKDPLIRQVMRADRVSLQDMRHLLQYAAGIRKAGGQTSCIPAGATPAKVSPRAEA
jgi:hypothetical protein